MSLVLRDVAVSFGGVAALAGVTFAVRPGTITSLIGPNGAGKTTAFNAITGYVRPRRGEIAYEGTPLTRLRPCDVARRGVVRTFQKTSLFPELSAFDNVMIGLHLRSTAGLWRALLWGPRLRAEERRLGEEAEGLLGLVGLAGQRHVVASALPYGDQRLLELAVALAARPRLLLLDEPAAGMTGGEKVAVMSLIRRLKDEGITVLLVEHDMRLVMGVSDHLVVLNGGRVIAEGLPQAIQSDPAVIEAYLGTAHAHA